MRGYSDENGCSPFWDAIGHHFFNMDFSTADYLSGIGQKFYCRADATFSSLC